MISTCSHSSWNISLSACQDCLECPLFVHIGQMGCRGSFKMSLFAFLQDLLTQNIWINSEFILSSFLSFLWPILLFYVTIWSVRGKKILPPKGGTVIVSQLFTHKYFQGIGPCMSEKHLLPVFMARNFSNNSIILICLICRRPCSQCICKVSAFQL